ncbi:uncharacterized protein LOC124933993 [Impatiens glandulifera]|uniref:uncharacterized protein LOC124933993 n=1 Tax=Impatiens glandulifera TaxID=253017 RepID=UPI001FB12FA8|nr:uncharacterized protein LOC124933993 [Impatiens glandulifera]
MASVPATLNLYGVLSESKRIVNAHSRHFLALSVLFLLPLAFSLIVYPTLEDALISTSRQKPTQTLLRSSNSYDLDFQTLILPLIYTIFVYIFSLFAVGSVSNSIHHGFYGRPVKLASAVKSLAYSFIPLVVTSIASGIAILLVCVCFGVFVMIVIQGIQFLGFEIDYNSSYSYGFFIIISVFITLLLINLSVNWSLAPVIVVIESKWGFEPLRRSAYLIKGMKLVSLSLMLMFNLIIGFFIWGGSSSSSSIAFDDGWDCAQFILHTVLSSTFVTMFMLNSLVSTAVLYMYCKALHGELAWEIAEEFSTEYVCLPFDDAKVPHVVYVSEP